MNHVLITAGSAVMPVAPGLYMTGENTGVLAKAVALRLMYLESRGLFEGTVHYLHSLTAEKPPRRPWLKQIPFRTADELLEKMMKTMDAHPCLAVVHFSEVPEYAPDAPAKAEDIAMSIGRAQAEIGACLAYDDLLDAVSNAPDASDPDGSLPFLEPNLLLRMRQNPRISGGIKDASPGSVVFLRKAYRNIDRKDMLREAAIARQGATADYVVAHDEDRSVRGRMEYALIGRSREPGNPGSVFGAYDSATKTAADIADIILDAMRKRGDDGHE